MKIDKQLAIMIPTFNRSGFLIRQLSYYQDQNFEGGIYIGDQSDRAHFDRLKEWRSTSRLRIHHIDCGRHSWREVFRSLPGLVLEPYVNLRADDDFLIMPGAREALRGILEIDGGIVGEEWYVHHLGKWVVPRAPFQRERALLGTAEERIAEFNKAWFPILNGIWPTALVRTVFAESTAESMQAHEWETAYHILSLAPCSYMNCALSLRVNHPGQLSQNAKGRSWHRWIDDHFPFIVRWASRRRGEKPPESVAAILKHMRAMPLTAEDYRMLSRGSRFVAGGDDFAKFKERFTHV